MIAVLASTFTLSLRVWFSPH